MEAEIPLGRELFGWKDNALGAINCPYEQRLKILFSFKQDTGICKRVRLRKRVRELRLIHEKEK